ncbi:MAG: molybdopterin-dependent oxidoreductase [Nitrospirae bacterium]|nr:molybdopterin-dependent oxidoreductase [Nitrospirota bacterium]
MSKMIRDLDYSRWTLNLTGLVKNPLALTHDALKRRPSREAAVTLECIENPVGGDTISNAIWRGVSLNDLLVEAGADPSAKKAVLKAADGYSDSIPLKRAMDGDVLLAYEMNGVPLPREHGYPLRAVVPGIYGMKNVKWIMEIEVTTADYRGYWQQRGWSDEAVIGIMSRIDSPGAYQELIGLHQPIRGIAFAGSSGIRQVEVSTDGGRTWSPSQIDSPLSPYTWVFWRLDWQVPRAGVYRIVVRATDRSGRLQTAEYTRGFPNGATGLHTVMVEVVSAK